MIGGDLLAFHAYDAADGGRPKLRVAALSWGAGGWPVLSTVEGR